MFQQIAPSAYNPIPLAPCPHPRAPRPYTPYLAQPADTALAFSAPLPWGGQLNAAMTPPVAKQFVDGLIVVGLAGVLVWGAVEYAKSRA